ncbi:MAG: transglutaminase N-terminal domain-containing protein, partial [Cypionkella sp.]|nr:transglutaminase N-terminal domain-containing protein [Cypionkella sp.]
MLLSVEHVTVYRYDRPVRGVVQSHRLTPSGCQGQKVLDWKVVVSDGLPGGAFRDGAGDWVQGWTVAGPVDEIEVRVSGRVLTTDLAGILRGHKELVPPEAYLRNTEATFADAALQELGQIIAAAESPLGGCHNLTDAISDAIAY